MLRCRLEQLQRTGTEATDADTTTFVSARSRWRWAKSEMQRVTRRECADTRTEATDAGTTATDADTTATDADTTIFVRIVARGGGIWSCSRFSRISSAARL